MPVWLEHGGLPVIGDGRLHLPELVLTEPLETEAAILAALPERQIMIERLGVLVEPETAVGPNQRHEPRLLEEGLPSLVSGRHEGGERLGAVFDPLRPAVPPELPQEWQHGRDMRPPQRNRTLGIEVVLDVFLHEAGHGERQNEGARDAAAVPERRRPARRHSIDHLDGVSGSLKVSGAPHADHARPDHDDSFSHRDRSRSPLLDGCYSACL